MLLAGLFIFGAAGVASAHALGAADSDTAMLQWWLPTAGLLLFGVGFGLAITPGTVLIIDGLPDSANPVVKQELPPWQKRDAPGLEQG